jgi:hypothetical protein
MRSWLRHIRGATALLELRGDGQLDTKFGRALFVQTRAHIIAGCLQTRTPIPELVVALSKKYCETTDSPAEAISPLTFHFCRLRSEVSFHPGLKQTESKTRAIVSQYTTITQQMHDWHRQLPSGFLPVKTVPEKPSASTLSDYYHVYDDIWTAGTVNNCNASYMLVNEALIIQLTYLRDHYARDEAEVDSLNDEILKARSTIIRLIHAVCASVPHLLKSNMAIAGIGLMWALYVSGQISPRAASLHVSTRRWITGRLETIGAEMGVKQATTLARFLREGVEVTELLGDASAAGEDDG